MSTATEVFGIDAVKNAWIQTYTGRRFDLLDPKPEQICLEDIATALSRIARFNGHSEQFYSVAQHCVFCTQLCDLGRRKQLLLHDAAEAYIGDLARPWKQLLYVLDRQGFASGVAIVEDRISRVIHDLFSVAYPGDVAEAARDVKRIDELALALEARDMMNADPVEWNLSAPPEHLRAPNAMHPSQAKKEFLYAAEHMGLKEWR